MFEQKGRYVNFLAVPLYKVILFWNVSHYYITFISISQKETVPLTESRVLLLCFRKAILRLMLKDANKVSINCEILYQGKTLQNKRVRFLSMKAICFTQFPLCRFDSRFSSGDGKFYENLVYLQPTTSSLKCKKETVTRKKRVPSSSYVTVAHLLAALLNTKLMS